MRIFEPHIHMSSRTTDDYEAMAAAGVAALVEPSFWTGQPRSGVGSFVDYFNALIGWERYRAGQFGIAHHCTIALNPKEANDPSFRAEVMEILPRYLAKDGVVGVGETGYDSITPAEDELLAQHLALAVEFDLPVLVHTPHRDKLAGTRRTLDVVKESGIAPERVLVDHNNELTAQVVLDAGVWAGFSIYPLTKMDERRMVLLAQDLGTRRIIVNSAADWGRSDPLKVAKTAQALLAAGFAQSEVERLVWDNPVEFYAQSDRLELTVQTDDSLSQGNSIQRGERA
ncbi:TatD family hydrolase [Kineosporia mesophila]|uniref:TatD family hydrolase n=1 Tax=Kineosporia mesophila TaxID=566012 RepID=A0ABP7AFQ2_9ACTN|nr:TatD family hydrolase [Kineosporia mesophila]MCD5354365.1 TatD family hydrolase [Kineosporia mesophila]